jgi:erythromycin esterase
METMDVPEAIEGSWDSLLHNIDYKLNRKKQVDKMIIFNKNIERPDMENLDDISKGGDKNRGQRAIGVVYNPIYDRFGNYVPTILSSRYDALLFIDNTTALSPLHIEPLEDKDLPETYPTGE